MPYRLYAFIMPVKPVYIIKDKLFSRVAIRHLFKDPAGVIAACSILEYLIFIIYYAQLYNYNTTIKFYCQTLYFPGPSLLYIIE